MPRGNLILSAVALGFSIIFPGSGLAIAQTKQSIYGQQLMTQQEMREYRQKMRTATSDEERQQLRLQHHQEMQERAKKKGVTLPDAPPARGMGRGMGPGQGMGPGRQALAAWALGKAWAPGMGPGQGMRTGPGKGSGPGGGR